MLQARTSSILSCRFVTTLLALTLASARIQAQDQCNDILKSGVHDTYQSISKENAKQAYKTALCDEHSSLYRHDNSANGAITAYGYGDGSGGFSNQTLSDMRSRYCADTHTQISEDDFKSLAQKTIDPLVVQNWNECMQHQGRGLFGNVDVNGSDVIFTIEWRGLDGVNSATVIDAPQISGVTCQELTIRKDLTLNDTSISQLCRRNGKDAVTFVVNTNRGPKTLKLSAVKESSDEHVARYEATGPVTPASPAMNVVVTRTNHDDSDHLDITFQAPSSQHALEWIRFGAHRGDPNGPFCPGNPPPSNCPFTPFEQVPVSTFPQTTGHWNSGATVTVAVDVPKQYSDATRGWELHFVIGYGNGNKPGQTYYASPNLLTGQQVQAAASTDGEPTHQ